MSEIISLGLWIKRRRKALDLTQNELARRVGCSMETIRKIEADARRPSRELAALLAGKLELAADERAAFVQAARAELGADRLASPTQSIARGAFVPVPAPSTGAKAPEQSRTAPPTNLSTPPTALLGREHEIAIITSLLRRPEIRLVSLTGPGGIGKTRLSLQIATEMIREFADGVYFVDLAPLRDPELVGSAIAQTLGVRESGGRPVQDILKDYLRDKHMLLLLDNFEQVIDAAPLIAELLARAARLKVLATSREVLHLRGEQEVAVPPLALPPGDGRRPTLRPFDFAQGRLTDNRQDQRSAVAQYAAIQLFIQRARAVQPAFQLTNANAPAVAEICIRLHGLPLAIELAAVRLKLFTPEALLTRLGIRIALLTGGARDLPARQQTIRNTIAWSYDLLTEAEQTLFRRLGVFVGGCTLEAAERVCAGVGSWELVAGEPLPTPNSQPHSPVLDGVAALIDKSLLRWTEGLGGEPRFVMLETIREYALERLEASGEAADMRQQHATYFLKFAEKYDPWPRIHAPPQEHWLVRLDTDYENLRAASEWFAEQGEAELSLQLAGALVGFWADRFHWAEGHAWMQAALAQSGNLSVVTRAKALVGASFLGIRLIDFITARAFVEQGLALFRGLNDKPAIALALLVLGNIALNVGEYAIAHTCAEECLPVFQEVSDQWGRALALQLLGHIAVAQGDIVRATIYNQQILSSFRQIDDKRGIGENLIDKGYLAQLQGNWQQAIVCYVETLAIFRQLGAKDMIAAVLHSLGGAVFHQGNIRQAAAHFSEGLALSREIGSPYFTLMNLAGMASTAAAQKQPERSARLFGASDALFDAMGIMIDPVDRLEYDRSREIARAELGEEAFAAAWAAGRGLALEQAIAEALEAGA